MSNNTAKTEMVVESKPAYKKDNAREGRSLKLVSTIFYQIFIFSPNDSSSKSMENVFYFI